MLILHGNMHSYQCFIGNPVFTLRFEVDGYPGASPIEEHQDARLTTSSRGPIFEKCYYSWQLTKEYLLEVWGVDILNETAGNLMKPLIQPPPPLPSKKRESQSH